MKSTKTSIKDAEIRRASLASAKRNKSVFKIRKKPFWMTRAMSEEWTREDVLRSTIVNTLIYILFILTITCYVRGARSTDRFIITHALQRQFIDRQFATKNDEYISFSDIKRPVDFWYYMTGHLLDSIFWPEAYAEKGDIENIEDISSRSTMMGKMVILRENHVLGVVRIRQVKVQPDSCIIHTYFQDLISSCYDHFSDEEEDKETFGLGKAPAWVYSDASETLSLRHDGTLTSYGGGGFYIDLTMELNSTRQLLSDLRDNGWLTHGTRAVFVDFSIYNANLNMFSICKLTFEFPSTGAVIPSFDFHTVDLLYFDDWSDFAVLILEMVFYIFILFYIAEGIREIIHFRLRYFKMFWSLVHWAIILSGIQAAKFSIESRLEVGPTVERLSTNPTKYGNLESIGKSQSLHDVFIAITLFFGYIKLLNHLNINRTMGQLNDTLAFCAMDILEFSFMFLIVFFAFAGLGYLLFGGQLESFSTIGEALFTLFRTNLGDFDYEEIENANRFLAPIYFLAYIFMVFFILMNMFLAIIDEAYEDVQTEISMASDEMQVTEYLSRGIRKLLYKCKCLKTAPEEKPPPKMCKILVQIKEALRNCDFSYIEIEMFFARYNIDPSVELTDKDIKQLRADLESVLAGDKKKESAASYVKVQDFKYQQERLQQINKTIGMLSIQVNGLLERLETIESTRK